MWKDIPNWEEYYEINENGDVRNKKTQKLLIGDINNAGYYRVCLYYSPYRERFFRHRLVATLFIENPNNLKEVNHIDGNKANNHVSNLEWCSRKDNERQARRIGIKKYKPFEVVFTDGTVKRYEFTPELAEELGVTKRTILNYLQNKSKGYTKFNIDTIKYIKKPND